MTELFQRQGSRKLGYAVDEVDEFFARAEANYNASNVDKNTAALIRGQVFNLEKHGYRPGDVDAALDRLENAVTLKFREQFVDQYGTHAWSTHLAEYGKSLYDRLSRPAGLRFRPARRGELGYHPQDVDALMQRLIDFFNSGTPLGVQDLRDAKFRRKTGSAAYDEAVVDVFISRAIDVILMAQVVES